MKANRTFPNTMFAPKTKVVSIVVRAGHGNFVMRLEAYPNTWWCWPMPPEEECHRGTTPTPRTCVKISFVTSFVKKGIKQQLFLKISKNYFAKEEFIFYPGRIALIHHFPSIRKTIANTIRENVSVIMCARCKNQTGLKLFCKNP